MPLEVVAEIIAPLLHELLSVVSYSASLETLARVTTASRAFCTGPFREQFRILYLLWLEATRVRRDNYRVNCIPLQLKNLWATFLDQVELGKLSELCHPWYLSWYRYNRYSNWPNITGSIEDSQRRQPYV